MATVQGAYIQSLPGLHQAIIKASALSKTKHFTFFHDFEQDVVIVKCVDFDGNVSKQAFTKEAMEDLTAEEFVSTLVQMGDVLAMPKGLPQKITAYGLEFAEKKFLKYAAMYGMDPAKMPAMIKDVPPVLDKSFALGISMTQEQLDAALNEPIPPNKNFATATKILEDYEAKKMMANKKAGIVEQLKGKLDFDGNLHVYDLGDGMLAPVDMCNEIALMLSYEGPKKKEVWIDPHADEKKACLEMAKSQADALAMASLPMVVVHKDAGKPGPEPIYPGKIFKVDPYMTDPNAWFMDDAATDFAFMNQVEVDKFIDEVNKHVNGPVNGHAAMIKPTPPPAVSIPKTPKQITKKSLEYFHKLMSGTLHG